MAASDIRTGDSRRSIRLGNPGKSRPKSGSALLLALIAVTVAAVFMTTILQVTTATSRRQAQAVDENRAFYLCEAALSEAIEAVRVGKRGQIGSFESPAVFGQGLVWVDATPAPGGQLRLESTAICGRGTATLGLVIEPVAQQLGFFADEELTIDSVVLIDGFNSDESDYREQVLGDRVTIDRSYPFLHIDAVNKLLFYEEKFYRYYEVNGDDFFFDQMVELRTLSEHPLYGAAGPYEIAPDDFVDEKAGELNSDYLNKEYDGVIAYFAALTELKIKNEQIQPVTQIDADVVGVTSWGNSFGSGNSSFGNFLGPVTDGPVINEGVVNDYVIPSSAMGKTTGGGGLLGSNGPVVVGGDSVEIYGDIVPGVGEQVTIETGGSVSGDTAPRLSAVELPTVEIPVIELMLPLVEHNSALPMVISPGTVGYERIDVASDAELIIRGPATVVIGELNLAEGAELTLDTQDGNVELFFTSLLNLGSGSIVTTPSRKAESVSIQVSANLPVDSMPPVRLSANSQFYGTVYAPVAEVVVGSNFEVYGGIVARVLDLQPGAKLHYDAEGSNALPRVVSWKIVEVPAAVRTSLASWTVDASALTPLSEAHDLGGIELRLAYTDLDGVERLFEGKESDFDWSKVQSVESNTRTGRESWDRGWWNDWWTSGGNDWWSNFGDGWTDSWGSNWGALSGASAGG